MNVDRRASGPERQDGAGSSGLSRLASVDLNLLVPLLALLEERSVTRAAERVQLSQPAMSHALRRIRRLLDDDVLVRQGGAMVLTPRGLELVGPVREALQRTAGVLMRSPSAPVMDRDVVTMAMTSSTAFVIGGAIARLLAERAPHVVLRIRTSGLAESATTLFRNEGVDVMLLPEVSATEFPRERLYPDRWVVVSSPSGGPGGDVLERIQVQPHVAFAAAQLRVRPYEVLDEHRIPYTIRRQVSDNLLVPHLVAASRGLAFLRWSVVRAVGDTLDLRVDEFPFPIPNLGIDMVWNPWLTNLRLQDELRDLLVDAALEIGARPR